MMEEEVVTRRGWFTHEEFLDMLGVTNLIPGPNSTEMAIYIGYRRGGVPGLLLAGVCFIVPAMLVTMVFAHLYVTYGMMPRLGMLMLGVRAAIIAVILGAVFRLAQPLRAKPFMLGAGLVTAVLSLLHADALLLLLAAGAAGIAWAGREKIRNLPRALAAVPFVATLYSSGSPATPPEGATLAGLGLFFLKIGSILYGGGYVLVAFLQEGLVDSRGWVTQGKLLDAIAVGQFTPGPLLSTATFIGYILFGVPGALVSTGAIFFPAFIFILIAGRFITRLTGSPVIRGFLDGVNAAALGLMTGACFILGESTLLSAGTIVIFVIALLVQLRWRINAAWIVAGGALAGWLTGIV